MATRLATVLCAGLLTLGHSVAVCAQHAVAHTDKSDAEIKSAPPSERWSIRAFLERRKERSSIRRRLAQPDTPRTPHWQAADPLHYSDQSSPLSRMRALKKWRVATLWRGQSSALVLGLVGNGYFGVRLDPAEPEGKPSRATD